MTTKAFYFFCDSCGGDTATYELINLCPYCHTGRQEFKLIGEAETETQRFDVRTKLEGMRATWTSKQRSTLGAKRKHRWFHRA